MLTKNRQTKLQIVGKPQPMYVHAAVSDNVYKVAHSDKEGVGDDV